MIVDALKKPKNMESFYYTHVHQYLFENVDESFAKYRARISHELKALRVSKEQIQNKRVLDVGTGLQALVFAEMGCEHVYHIDINQSQVDWLNRYCKENGIKNLSSNCFSVTKEPERLPSFDVAFIYGVLHHLEQPGEFITALNNVAQEEASMLFRCYRSGTWSRWLVAHLRKLSHLTTVETVQKVFLCQFPLEDGRQFLSDMVDDLFTPIWKCFSPELMRRECDNMGADFYCPDSSFEYDFTAPDENFRCRFSATGKKLHSTLEHSNEITHGIDQLRIQLPKQFQKTFKMVWNEFIEVLNGTDPVTATIVIITLYRLSRRFPLYDYYCINQQGEAGHCNSQRKGTREEALITVLLNITRNFSDKKTAA